jgi:hypothetical protein
VPPTATPTPTNAPNGLTINFNDLANPNRTWGGNYPTGIANWGTNQWYLSGPWGQFTTNSIGFNGAGPTSANFAFTPARRLVSVQAYNGGTVASNVTLLCDGAQQKLQSVAVGQMATIPTGWAGNCDTVIVGSSNGWNTNFDNFVTDQVTVPPTNTPTPVPPTNTPTPTATAVPPTATPTPTPTAVPPTATPTSTPVPPTATPTATAVPTLIPCQVWARADEGAPYWQTVDPSFCDA